MTNGTKVRLTITGIEEIESRIAAFGWASCHRRLQVGDVGTVTKEANADSLFEVSFCDAVSVWSPLVTILCNESMVEEVEMTIKPNLLTAHCSLIHGLNTAWLELWSRPNLNANSTPSAEAVGRYVATIDALAAKYHEDCYAAVGCGE